MRRKFSANLLLTRRAFARIMNTNIVIAMIEKVTRSAAFSRECLSRLQAGADADYAKFPLEL